MVILVVILCAALLLSVATVVLLKRDIRSIRAQMQDIRRTDSNMRVRTSTHDGDISALAYEINAALDERRDAAVSAKRANSELKRAITNISHDLRTPLTSVLGYVQMLRADGVQHIEVVEERVKYLSRMLDKLFEYSKAIDDDGEVTLQSVNVCNILRNILSAHYDGFITKGFDVWADIPDTPILCCAAADILTRALENLVQNAYTHGERFFRVCIDGGVITFINAVTDADSIDVERMFDRFYTADASRGVKASGLGLPIARELLSRMGGNVRAELYGDMLIVTVTVHETNPMEI